MTFEDLTPFDKKAWDEIAQWKSQGPGFLEKIGQTSVGQKIGNTLSHAKEIIEPTVVGTTASQVIELSSKAINGMLQVLNEAASWSIRTDAIYRKFQSSGYEVSCSDDIGKLSLQQVEKVTGRLDAKYVVTAFGEGVATGALGLPGIIADIPTLFALNLRGVNTISHFYGFDLDLPAERGFAMNVMMCALSPSDTQKQIYLGQLSVIAKDVARRKTWVELEEYAFVKGTEKLAESLGIRLTKAKLGQFIPVVGSAIGGGFNAYFTGKTMEAAYYLYRERFLEKKYEL